MNPIRIDNTGFAPKRTAANTAAPDRSFGTLLEAEKRRVSFEGVRLSSHASTRLEQAGRTLSPTELGRLGAAIEQASKKGAKESLVLMGDLAFVVSVPNNTVITAVTGERIKHNVFTNIDSAVLVDGLDLKEGASNARYSGVQTAQGGRVIL